MNAEPKDFNTFREAVCALLGRRDLSELDHLMLRADYRNNLTPEQSVVKRSTVH